MKAIVIQKAPWVIGILLVLAMAITRSHHFGSIVNLPDASLAIFFLAGFYLRSPLVLLGLLCEALLIDYVVTTYAGVSDWCITPAYYFLVPAYAAIWFAGRWYATRYRQSWMTLIPLVAALAAGILLAFAISNLGFYLFSGRTPGMEGLEYTLRVTKYLPSYATSTFVYVAVAALVHPLTTAWGVRPAVPRAR